MQDMFLPWEVFDLTPLLYLLNKPYKSTTDLTIL